MEINLELPAGLRPLFLPRRYKGLYGGRGSAKSWTFARALVSLTSGPPKRVLCARELQKSIAESVHELLERTIYDLKVDALFNIKSTYITSTTGSEFIFEGLKGNIAEIKSMEAIDIVWVEEAEAVSDRSWRTLIPTIRKPGSEIWVSFNPFEEHDPTYQRFITPHRTELERDGVYDDGRRFIRRMNYPDNPWFPGSELETEMLEDKANNYRLYLHIWEGQPLGDYGDSIIKPEWIEAAVDSHVKLGFKPRGIKALAHDPADEGQDEKAMIIRHGPVVQVARSWKDGDVEDAALRVAEAAINAQCTDLVFDAIGVGTGTKVVLRRELAGRPIRITPFIGSAAPEHPDDVYTPLMMEDDETQLAATRDFVTVGDTFLNRRAQGYKELADRFELTYRAIVKKQFVSPEKLISLSSRCEHLSQLKSELVRIQRKRSRGNKSLYQVESKTDMRARDIPSPNLADALMYAFMTEPPEPSVSKWSGINQRIHGRR